jgi:starch phosphorylase
MNHQEDPRLKRYSLPGYRALENLALNLRWSWSHAADKVWETLDPELWRITQNPWVVLQTVSIEKLKSALSDADFPTLVEEFVESNRTAEESPAWFQRQFPDPPLKSIAYFSMEYMLCEALPIYSGGLGNVAGDQLKAASDLGIPVYAIGLLYQEGYFRQMIDLNGTQQALYPFNDPGQLPITPLRTDGGEWLRVRADFPGFSIWLRTWHVKVGRVHLFLLDSNDAANLPIHRGITGELYGGGTETRLKQELILGIGGWRLLEALDIHPDVCHLNEGHAAFAILERARHLMSKLGCSFPAALETTRAGNLFTTHTAVPAGFDLFEPALLSKYLKNYAETDLKISWDDFLRLGRMDPYNPNEPFNMAFLAIRGSGAINGVSALHEKVSKSLFSHLFPRWPEQEVPVGHVTNGVHAPSWDSAEADRLWSETCGKERWLGTTETLTEKMCAAKDEKIWNMRNLERKKLVEYIRNRYSRQLASIGAPLEEVERAKHVFDPGTLTLGFARRFATYKRPNLLLRDQTRLIQLLTRKDKPVQLVIAGKAHPADEPGKALIREWFEFTKNPLIRDRVVFLSDYDMHVTEHLVQGVDVWLNTPRRPWEACGTSGMKILVNGGINLSELDGWWAEAYAPEVGFAIGDGAEHPASEALDTHEAEELFQMLEQSVIPPFYERNSEGIPQSWIQKIRLSMAHLTPLYSSNRSVREYTERYYVPLSKKYHEREGEGEKIHSWRTLLEQNWHNLRFGPLEIHSDQEKHLFSQACYLDSIPQEAVQVSLFANPDISIPMKYIKELQGSPGMHVYEVSVPNDRPAADYTPRITPFYPGVSIPLECPLIFWES